MNVTLHYFIYNRGIVKCWTQFFMFALPLRKGIFDLIWISKLRYHYHLRQLYNTFSCLKMLINCNPRQNIWNKVKISSKIGQY